MTCPVCKSHDARRSRRQKFTDYAFGAMGVYPWRCRTCQSRYYARLMSLTDSLHAHCPICGNAELKRISGEHVNAPLAFLGRWFSIPAYRCEPCRHKYFSIRPQRTRDRELAGMSSAD